MLRIWEYKVLWRGINDQLSGETKMRIGTPTKKTWLQLAAAKGRKHAEKARKNIRRGWEVQKDMRLVIAGLVR